MEITHILAKVVIYLLFAFAFYTWNKIRIITEFNKRSMFYLVLLLAGLALVIYVDFIENLSNEIKKIYFQYSNYSIILFLFIFNWLKKKKENVEDVYLKPRIVAFILLTILMLYVSFFINK